MRKNKVFPLMLALMLCVSAFLFPTAAFAASPTDTTPPTVTAKLSGDTLQVEAKDDNSGVQAVYIDSTRINTLVDGKASVALKDYAGTGKQVSVYATDFAGNRSSAVKLDNPYYKAPAALMPTTQTQTPQTTTPSTESGQTSTQMPSASQPAGDSSSAAENETVTAVPDGAFTPDGTGTVLDSASESADDKQFYTITTADGNVFYLVIDGKRDANNVYFLNTVTEEDLLALAEKEGGSVSVVPQVQTCTCDEKCEAGKVDTSCPVCKTDLTGCTGKAADTSTPAEQPAKESGNDNIGMIVLIVVVLAVVGGAGYYFKIVRPKKEAFDDEDDEDYGEDFDSGAEYGEDAGYLPEDDESEE